MGDPRARFIAIDWGTTNRRTYLVEGGEVTSTGRDNCGVLAMDPADYPAALADIRAAYGDLPVYLAGMVGSNRGWRDAGYLPAPVTLEMLASALVEVADRAWIVPGVCVQAASRADVMRGEEVQLLGAVLSGAVPPDGLLAQPGTHCKWARMNNGALTDFQTAMTGELFAIVREHSLLAGQLSGAIAAGAAFLAGVEESRRRDLLGSLFAIRAAGVLGLRDDSDAASFASGLLIGTDCLAHADTDHVYLLADETLGELYAAALAALDIRTTRVDSHAAFMAGINRIQEFAR